MKKQLVDRNGFRILSPARQADPLPEAIQDYLSASEQAEKPRLPKKSKKEEGAIFFASKRAA